MVVGLVGAGNIARALARGWGEPVLCTDGGSGRAAELVRELGGEALDSNAELARRADLIVLCHKPAQLEAVAAEIGDAAKAVASLLAVVPISALQSAYPDRPVVRLLPNTAIEVCHGVICHTPTPGIDAALEQAVLERFSRVGRIVTLPEQLIDIATAVSGTGPAYLALVAEAQIDAAVKYGLPAPVAAELVSETFAGFAELLRARDNDTLAVRRDVTSPGGVTARGLAALERGGVRAAFADALDAVAGQAGR
ncbi:MAG TPA: pyrroline-5-carboxylate reductase [Solirubrobacteraceae bacterium]|nr:pyrroline-5-carboxylate reductase [Solirubrobacteraceae bacterium]